MAGNRSESWTEEERARAAEVQREHMADPAKRAAISEKVKSHWTEERKAEARARQLAFWTPDRREAARQKQREREALQPERKPKIKPERKKVEWTPERRAAASARAKAWWTPERQAEAGRKAKEYFASQPIGTFKTDSVCGGAVFGALTVQAPFNKQYTGPASERAWICRCECGELCVRRADKLLWGNTKRPSCGCRQIKMIDTQIARWMGRKEKVVERLGEQAAEQEDLEARLLAD